MNKRLEELLLVLKHNKNKILSLELEIKMELDKKESDQEKIKYFKSKIKSYMESDKLIRSILSVWEQLEEKSY